MAQILATGIGRWPLFSALRHREFRLLWLGVLGTVAGYWIQMVAQGWLVFQMTDSPFWLGVVSAASAFPILVFGLFGGVLADRVNRRRLLICTRALIAALVVLLAILVNTNLIAIWHIVVLALLTGTAWSMDMPARQAMVPNLVPAGELMNAIAITNSALNGAAVFGPALAGFLVDIVGFAGCFYLTALGHLAMVWALLAMKDPEPNYRITSASLWRHLGEGLAYVGNNHVILTLLTMVAVLGIFGTPYTMLMPVFARDELGVGARGLGVLMSAAGMGALVGSLLLASLGNIQRKGWLIIGAGTGYGVMLLLFASSQLFLLSLAFLLAVGISSSSFMTLSNTLVQSIIPNEMRGRVMSIYMLGWGAMPLGSVIFGRVAESYGARAAVAGGAAIFLVFVLSVGLLRSTVRRL